MKAYAPLARVARTPLSLLKNPPGGFRLAGQGGAGGGVMKLMNDVLVPGNLAVSVFTV